MIKQTLLLTDTDIFTTEVASYSEDGINWTEITLPSSVIWYSVCYSDYRFLAIWYYSNIATYSYNVIT